MHMMIRIYCGLYDRCHSRNTKNRKTLSPELNIAYKYFQMYPCITSRKLNSFKENVVNLKVSPNNKYTIDEIRKLHFTQNPYMCSIIADDSIFFCEVK